MRHTFICTFIARSCLYNFFIVRPSDRARNNDFGTRLYLSQCPMFFLITYIASKFFLFSDGDDDKTDEDEEKAGASGEEEQDEEEQAPPQSRIIQSDEEEEEIPSTPQPSQ